MYFILQYPNYTYEAPIALGVIWIREIGPRMRWEQGALSQKKQREQGDSISKGSRKI